MPRSFDNIEASLLPALPQTLAVSDRADFTVGYFNLRGWKASDDLIEKWDGGEGHQGRLLAKVLSITRAIRELPSLCRYRVVLLDESHNLRNRVGKRYRAIQEYIQGNESRCILLSATPYNRTNLDLSSQLPLSDLPPLGCGLPGLAFAA